MGTLHVNSYENTSNNFNIMYVHNVLIFLECFQLNCILFYTLYTTSNLLIISQTHLSYHCIPLWIIMINDKNMLLDLLLAFPP